MSGEVPIQVVVAAFRDEQAAGEALKELKSAQGQGLIKIDDAAVLRRDASNKLHITETADMSGGKGAVVGGVTGAVLGVLGGPAVWAATGVGALVGGLAAKLHDSGFRDARLRQLGEGLQPGTSAIVAVVEHTWVRQVARQLEQEGADVVTEGLRQDIAEQLQAGRDVAYSALSAAGVLDVERAVGGQDYGEVDRIVASDQGVYFEAGKVDKEGAAAVAGVVTDQGAVIVGGETPRPDSGGATAAAPPSGAATAPEQPQASQASSQPPADAR
jgi:uncharacterized membrane protein